ncbi:hypothetical protein MANES_11G090556v8 [Manihot esculenta]|uniref:Uncharacterized protein n=1 Tax=Manihot esculenta TaxID=3983 RepID=A0ACB7GUN9_MANES|nr:hypothetical protein MANES_11G090556v8 [Manihot esculenta]
MKHRKKKIHLKSTYLRYPAGMGTCRSRFIYREKDCNNRRRKETKEPHVERVVASASTTDLLLRVTKARMPISTVGDNHR